MNPEAARLIKKTQKTYSVALDPHPYGDHDDTPPELRAGK
jgi:hypothetical protein